MDIVFLLLGVWTQATHPSKSSWCVISTGLGAGKSKAFRNLCVTIRSTFLWSSIRFKAYPLPTFKCWLPGGFSLLSIQLESLVNCLYHYFLLTNLLCLNEELNFVWPPRAPLVSSIHIESPGTNTVKHLNEHLHSFLNSSHSLIVSITSTFDIVLMKPTLISL